jgi:DNA-binding transcriptional ArsR family regulator
VAGPTAPPDGLMRLLGRTRALVLATLDRPLSTTALAALVELSPAGASRHLLALRDGGLVSAKRRGHEMRYSRTKLGLTLLRSGQTPGANS